MYTAHAEESPVSLTWPCVQGRQWEAHGLRYGVQPGGRLTRVEYGGTGGALARVLAEQGVTHRHQAGTVGCVGCEGGKAAHDDLVLELIQGASIKWQPA